MAYLLIKQKVSDYLAWKNAFDKFLEYRKIGGELSCEFYQTSAKKNELIVLSEWKSIENAKEFLKSQSFQMIKELEDKSADVQLVKKQVFS